MKIKAILLCMVLVHVLPFQGLRHWTTKNKIISILHTVKSSKISEIHPSKDDDSKENKTGNFGTLNITGLKP